VEKMWMGDVMPIDGYPDSDLRSGIDGLGMDSGLIGSGWDRPIMGLRGAEIR